jgi:hypothetical protein
MKYPKNCIAIVFFIALVIMPKADTLAFDKHRLSFSIGGDWTNCFINNYKGNFRIDLPYFPEDRYVYSGGRNDRDGLAGSLGLSAEVSYKFSSKFSSELLGFFAREWGIHYPNPMDQTQAFLDDYANRLPRTIDTALPNSNLIGSGLGISYYSDNHNIHSVLSAAILFCRANVSLEKYRYTTTTRIYEISQSKFRGWGMGTEVSYGLLLRISGNYFLNPNLGYRYINTSLLKDNGGNKYSAHGLDYSGLRLGLNFKYAL